MDRNGDLWDGQKSVLFEGGSPKDCVIMGILKPDDPVDLKHLDYFRKKKMKIASIGPMTRGMQAGCVTHTAFSRFLVLNRRSAPLLVYYLTNSSGQS